MVRGGPSWRRCGRRTGGRDGIVTMAKSRVGCDAGSRVRSFAPQLAVTEYSGPEGGSPLSIRPSPGRLSVLIGQAANGASTPSPVASGQRQSWDRSDKQMEVPADLSRGTHPVPTHQPTERLRGVLALCRSLACMRPPPLSTSHGRRAHGSPLANYVFTTLQWS